MPIEFDYEAGLVVAPLSVRPLLRWIGQLHSELASTGAWESLSNEMHQQLMILASEADRIDQ